MRKGFSLGGLLVGLVLIGMLAAALYYGQGAFGGPKAAPRADGRGTTVLGAAKARAEDEVCRSNLNQVRQAIAVFQTQDPDGAFPRNLEETRLGSSFYSCPIGNEPYVYDPSSGRVVCSHPGHHIF